MSPYSFASRLLMGNAVASTATNGNRHKGSPGIGRPAAVATASAAAGTTLNKGTNDDNRFIELRVQLATAPVLFKKKNSRAAPMPPAGVHRLRVHRDVTFHALQAILRAQYFYETHHHDGEHLVYFRLSDRQQIGLVEECLVVDSLINGQDDVILVQQVIWDTLSTDRAKGVNNAKKKKSTPRTSSGGGHQTMYGGGGRSSTSTIQADNNLECQEMMMMMSPLEEKYYSVVARDIITEPRYLTGGMYPSLREINGSGATMPEDSFDVQVRFD